ncbi:MAG: T9SS type A sorting domain-containing protein [Bacteroidetes bacterium]|nr:T9SS type A sorting domain-containing protein [Bacteroidota bacterium]MCW5897198.1 T9SS type A sorting domain-containing protein [Bacteroidota bacterium]
MKKIALVAACLVITGIARGQTPFTATYNLAGDGNNVPSFAYNGTSYAGISSGSLVKEGISSSSSTGNFRGSNWPTGATNGSDVFTGSIDLNKYIGVTVAAVPGYKFTITSVSFGIGRSATGPRQWQWRGSHDGHATPFANFTTLNAGLTSASGILTTPDSDVNWTGNVLGLGVEYEELAGTAEFRLYGFNSEGTTGTGGLQGNITLTGTFELTGGATILLNTSSFNGSFGSVPVGGSSGSSSFVVSGSELIDDITITPPAGFEIRTGINPFSSIPIILARSGDVVNATAIEVRFSPAVEGPYSGNISCVSTGAASQSIPVSGTGVMPIPFQVVFHETMGTVSTTTSIAAHVSAGGFDSDNLTFSGTSDVRASNASAGYSAASGGANIFFSGGSNASFEIAGITTTGLNALELSFGIRKDALALDGSDFFVEVSDDGLAYSALTFSGLPTASGSTGWYSRTASGTIPATENLRIRFRSSASSAYRIDDILLRNNAASPAISANGPTSFCEGGSVTLTSSAAASYLWSTGATTQSIAVSVQEDYSVTVTDAKGNSATSSPLAVTVIPVVAAAGGISGPTTVSSGQSGVGFSIADVTGAQEYEWTVPSGASIASGQGTTSITVDWGAASGDVSVTPKNSCFSGASSNLAVSVGSVSNGTISGTILRSGGGGMENVTVKLLDADGASIEDFPAVISNASGEYAFADVPSGIDYQVIIIEPLGYAVDANPKGLTLPAGGSAIVDFTLTQAVIANRARSVGYWKHQFDEHRCRRHRWDENLIQLNSYIEAVHQHYTPHFDVFANLLTINDWDDVLSLRRHPSMQDKAKKQLAALVMNFVSLKIGQHTIVTKDNRTAGDVLTYVSMLVTDGISSNDALARDLATKVNNKVKINSGIIPTGNILYKGGNMTITWGFDVPEEFSLMQNYPNPFNPTTTIAFSLPVSGHTRLSVYDVLGREVQRLLDGHLNAGRYETVLDARDLASGVYFYRLQSEGLVQTRKLTLMR